MPPIDEMTRHYNNPHCLDEIFKIYFSTAMTDTAMATD
jgi:hypothetical protein